MKYYFATHVTGSYIGLSRSSRRKIGRQQNVVSRSQTTFSSFIFGREENGSGTPTIEKPVLASTATRGG